MTFELSMAFRAFVRGDPTSPSGLESLRISNVIFKEADTDTLFYVLSESE
jgi:hypothetical protein